MNINPAGVFSGDVALDTIFWKLVDTFLFGSLPESVGPVLKMEEKDHGAQWRLWGTRLSLLPIR